MRPNRVRRDAFHAWSQVPHVVARVLPHPPSTQKQEPPLSDGHRVRFQGSNGEDDEETRLRRGSVSKELRNQIAIRGMIGRNAVSQGYATNRLFSRSQSDASIFRDPKPEFDLPTPESGLDNPSNTLWKSNYTKLNRTKSTSTVISGLNDDVLRAGWRRNEPGPLWEQSRELDPDREAVVEIPEEDGFDVEEMDFDVPSTDSAPTRSGDLLSMIQEDGSTDELIDSFGQPGSLSSNLKSNQSIFLESTSKRQFSKTQSMPVGGSFGTRAEQPKFYREFDDTFMRMDVEF
ncbi:hypothetical protein O181_006262 [Austropuccinia psidii MF-1]|uniref:Uncharacterized protein n=1 Tax=Austropuccinia psidii MF-1 TaxID=1389203 RepID=A0A9Q3BKF2_9BASI|nr:hypothetical protein [Austropuccinia psidii MF-1]